MADMFALVSTSSPESFSFNWAATVRTRDLGSSDVMLHRSAVASMVHMGSSQEPGHWVANFPHIRRKY